MIKRYLVTGNWNDKTTNRPMSGIVEITRGINKNGQPYEIADTNSRETLEGTYAVGTILTANMQIVPESASASNDKTSLKINSRQ